VNGPEYIVGVILAGGKSRRMGGGDKALRLLAGRPLIAHVIDRVRPQVRELAINANADPTRFAGLGLPVIPDLTANWPGPLAGVLAGLAWARREAPLARWLLTAPTDTPFLPLDLTRRLRSAAEEARAPVAVAASASGSHPTVALWSLDLDNALSAYLDAGRRKTMDFAAKNCVVLVSFDSADHDPFLNVNTLEDLERGSRRFSVSNWHRPEVGS
jgi:molybdenum cofactor guanylyltransferase